MTTVTSRRDEHKNQTRRALRQAALELFSTRGYDTATTDEIADRVGVSPRTFFRYFPTKESVLFIGKYNFIQSFAGVYLAQPASLSDIEAIGESYRILAPGLARSRHALLLYEQAVASSPTLRGRAQEHSREDAVVVADVIATRRGLAAPDESCALLAAVGSLTHKRALDRWLAGPSSSDLEKVIADEFELLGNIASM